MRSGAPRVPPRCGCRAWCGPGKIGEALRRARAGAFAAVHAAAAVRHGGGAAGTAGCAGFRAAAGCEVGIATGVAAAQRAVADGRVWRDRRWLGERCGWLDGGGRGVGEGGCDLGHLRSWCGESQLDLLTTECPAGAIQTLRRGTAAPRGRRRDLGAGRLRPEATGYAVEMTNWPRVRAGSGG